MGMPEGALCFKYSGIEKVLQISYNIDSVFSTIIFSGRDIYEPGSFRIKEFDR